jgi:hypothetical protein
MRRRAIICGLLLVAVVVALGATVFSGQVANARSLAQAVFVSNTPSQPVPVHEQGTAPVDPRQEEVSVAKSVSFPTAGQVTTDVYAVPAGKQLIVEYVAAHFGGIGAANSVALFMDCSATCAGQLPVVLQTQASGVSAGSEAVHFAVPAGHVIRFTGESSGAAGADITLGGHLEPTQ